VEAVANISNSAEQLVALWTLGLYLVLGRAAERDVPWRDALLAAGLFVLAMLSKETGSMSLAIALLAAVAWRPLRDVTPLGVMLRRYRRVLIAGAAALAVVVILRSLVLGSSLGGASMAAVGIGNMSAPQRAWAMLSLGPLILGLLGWPGAQNPYYGPSNFPTGVHALLAASSTIVVLTLAIVAAVRLARRDTRPLAAVAWMLLAFLPASNLFLATGQILAERTLYMPSIGVAMLLAWGMERLAVAMAHKTTRRVVLGICGVAMMMVCSRLALLSQRATAAWRTNRAILNQMIAADPRGYRGHYLLALDLRGGKSADSVVHEFATAYGLYARDPQLNYDYARFLLERQQAADAAKVTRTLMDDSRMRNDADAIKVYLEARGRAYGADSVLVAASRLFRLQPHPTAALYVGMAHEARGEKEAALKAYQAGLRLAPGDSALAARAAELQ
jgi:hypothetical protein